MKKYRSLLLLFVVLGIALGCGCGGGTNVVQFTERKILRYLSSKYDDRFTYRSVNHGALGSPQTTVFCTCEKYPDMLVSATYDRSSGKFYDNYIEVKYADRVDEELDRIVSACLGETPYFQLKFRESVVNMESDCRADITYEEFIRGKIMTMAVYADNQTTRSEEEILRVLTEEIAESDMDFYWVDFYFFDEFDPDWEEDTSARNWLVVNEEYTRYLGGRTENDELIFRWEK